MWQCAPGSRRCCSTRSISRRCISNRNSSREMLLPLPRIEMCCSGQASSKLRTGIKTALVFLIAMLGATGSAHAVDYVSVADNAAVLYDAPSLKAKKIYVVSRYLPLEQVVNLDNWVKVRDRSGGLAWIEKRALSSKRFVVVTSAVATIRQAPEEKAPVVAQIKQQ